MVTKNIDLVCTLQSFDFWPVKVLTHPSLKVPMRQESTTHIPEVAPNGSWMSPEFNINKHNEELYTNKICQYVNNGFR